MREQHGQQQELQNDSQAPSLMPYLDATLERPCQAREQKVRRARGKRVAVQYLISTIRARALVRVFSSPIVCYPTWQRTQGVQQQRPKQQPKQLPRPAFSMAAPQMHIEPCGNATQAVSKALGCWLPEQSSWHATGRFEARAARSKA